MSTNFNIPNHKLIGHRGVAGLRPENTYCSFAYAKELGLDWIEFDILLTLDENWVVMHDDTVDRTTNGHGFVHDMTLEQLEHLEAGLWFYPPYPAQKIPTLEKTLEQARKLNLFCNIEIKGAALTPEHHAILIVQFLLHHPEVNLAKIMLSSFTLPCLIKIRELMPEVQIGYLVNEFAADTITITQHYKFTSINCNANTITSKNLAATIAAQLPVFLYTINDIFIANFWLNQGVTKLFTDRPDLLLAHT